MSHGSKILAELKAVLMEPPVSIQPLSGTLGQRLLSPLKRRLVETSTPLVFLRKVTSPRKQSLLGSKPNRNGGVCEDGDYRRNES